MNKPDYLISTPENVDLHLELAGLGNRIMAAFVDTLAISTLNVILLTFGLGVVIATESTGAPAEVKNSIYYWSIAIILLLLFAINIGYYILFEGIWQGQTPGKKFAGIRVIEANGQPIGWGAVCIRNLLRLIDQFPSIFPGIIFMVLDKNERRLGDFAAGTLVIRERLQSLSTSDLRIVGNPAVETVVDTGQISPDEYNLLVTFLKRRDMMAGDKRAALANDLATHFQRSLSLDTSNENPERFIEKIFIAYKQKAELLNE